MKHNRSNELDFGWSHGVTHIFVVAAFVFLAATAVFYAKMPKVWPLYTVTLALALNCLIGGGLVKSAIHSLVTLPLVGLFKSNDDLVLDAGCGAGRTTISVSKALRKGQIVSLDRFDSNYIDDGGRGLLQKNLRIAGIADRVSVQNGDITDMPFEEAHFDSAVSAHAIDHLGPKKQKGMEEIYRVLKPGGRFLMVVWVPGLKMFAIANVISLFLTSKGSWRGMAKKVGFDVRDEGMINGVWFVLLEKPALTA